MLNRSNGRQPLFRKEADYDALERVIEEAHAREPLRILAYCVMPTHWGCGQNREPIGSHRQSAALDRWSATDSRTIHSGVDAAKIFK